ncbi:MAG: uroporphyrinogen-III synthase [Ilumatobacteraceae bacterium]
MRLDGRRVVVTRPREQAGSLVEALEARGARPVVLALIEIVDEPAGMAALAAVDVGAFDWVIVTSPNGARRLVDVHAHSLDGVRLAAVGATTAEVLPRCDLVPARQRAAGLLGELPRSTASALVVQAVDAAPTLVAGLAERGWDVTAIAPYRSAPRRPSAGEQLAALSADAVLFASGSAVRAWVEVFGTSAPPVVVVIGPQTAADAMAAGLEVTVVAGEHSVGGLVVAAEQALRGSG